jgi:hypothetical protein
MANCKSLLTLLALSVFVLFLASFTYAEESRAEELENQGVDSESAQLSFARHGRRFPRRQPNVIYRTPTQIVYSNVKKPVAQFPEQPIVPAVECQAPQPIIQTETVLRTIVQTATETVPQLIERTLTCTVPRFIERTMTETNVETETITQRVPQFIERTLTCTIPQLVERTLTETNVETETETITQTVPRLVERTLTCTIPQLVERTLTETVTQTLAARTKSCPTYVKPLATTERSTFEASSRLTIIGTQKSSFETTKQPVHRPFYTRSVSSASFSSPTVSPIVIGSARSSPVEDNDDDMSGMNEPSGTYY